MGKDAEVPLIGDAKDTDRIARFGRKVGMILNSLIRGGFLVRSGVDTFTLGSGTSSLSVSDGITTVNDVGSIVFSGGATVSDGTGGEADVAITGGGGSNSIPVGPFTAPVSGAYSWVNQNGATVDTSLSPGGIYLEQVTNNIATDNLFGRVKTIPTAPYTVLIAFQANYTPPTTGNADDVIRGGIVLRNSGSGKMVTWDINQWTGSADVRLQILNWNSATSVSAGVKSQLYGVSVPIMWLAIQDDNAGNRNYLISSNGYKWNKWYTEASTNFITPNQIGFFLAAGTGTAGYAYGMWLLSWAETSP